MIKIQSIDLFTDWVGIVKTELENKGYTFTGNDSEMVSIQYFNFLKRIIPSKPRQIKKSDVFSCPADLVAGLDYLEKKVLTGQNILPHLSRKLKNLDEIDELLYDWGIFHIHLGTTVESDGYIKRTGPLLFGFYDIENFYFLNVMPHGSWTRQEMLRTIHRNWPHTIEAYRIKSKDVVGLEHNVTDDEIKQLRRAKINVLIEVEPAVIYVTPGGGFVASGHSLEVIERHMANKKSLDGLEERIKTGTDLFLKSVYGDDLSFITNLNLDFKLVNENGKFHLQELNNNLKIRLNQ